MIATPATLADRIREHRSALWSERRNLRDAGLWNSDSSFDEEIFRARLKLAQWHLARTAAPVERPREPRFPSTPRPGLVGGKGPRQCVELLPRPAPTERLDVTIPGMPSPAAAFALREEEPFPLVRMKRLPAPPRAPEDLSSPKSGTRVLSRPGWDALVRAVRRSRLTTRSTGATPAPEGVR